MDAVDDLASSVFAVGSAGGPPDLGPLLVGASQLHKQATLSLAWLPEFLN